MTQPKHSPEFPARFSLSDGGSIDAIGHALEISVPRRTLQRRLAALVAEGRLIRDGRGQGTRYRLPGEETAPPPHSAEARTPATVDYHIPLSDAGASVGRAVRAPIQQRPPVGYRREFLDDYRPGVTWYLPVSYTHLTLPTKRIV